MTADTRFVDYLAWERRKDDLSTPLIAEEWARLRLELREQCANHKKTDPLYALASDCDHDLPADDAEDDLHKWGDEELLCMERVVGYACICQDGYCSQASAANEAHDDLWYAVSADKRRADRAAHLSDAVTKAWLDTELTLHQVQDLAASCTTEAELHARIAATTTQEQQR